MEGPAAFLSQICEFLQSRGKNNIFIGTHLVCPRIEGAAAVTWRKAGAMQQYEEQGLLSSAAQSTVVLARGAADGRLYAVKRVRCIPCASKEAQMALAYAVQEARLLMQVRHPNVVRAVDFFIEGRDHSLVLEYCRCGDLDQQIRAAAQRPAEGRIGPASILGWMAGIASAAEHIHAKAVIHRDLKPANVFLQALDGLPSDVRVGDLGAARQLHAGQDLICAKLTGTKAYMVGQSCNAGPGSRAPICPPARKVWLT
jgi:serine/threonine protein kinase